MDSTVGSLSRDSREVKVEQNILRRDREKRGQCATLACREPWFSTLPAQKNHLESFLKIRKFVLHPPEILTYLVCWNSFSPLKIPR